MAVKEIISALIFYFSFLLLQKKQKKSPTIDYIPPDSYRDREAAMFSFCTTVASAFDLYS